MNWYYKENNEVKGPISTDELTVLFTDGKVSKETPLMRDDQNEWKLLDDLFHLDDEGHADTAPKSSAGQFEESGPKQIENRTCAHSGEVWPEHMMTLINGEWFCKKYVDEVQTAFMAKHQKAKKVKTIIVSLVAVVALAAGGFFFFQQSQKKSGTEGEEDVAGIMEAVASSENGGAPGDAGSDVAVASEAVGEDPAKEMAEAAADRQEQMANTTKKILDMFEVDGMPGGVGGGDADAAGVEENALAAADGKSWPQFLLNSQVVLLKGGIFSGGSSFIVKRGDGSIVGFADVSALKYDDDESKLMAQLKGLNERLVSWDMYDAADRKSKVRFDKVLAQNADVAGQVKRMLGYALVSRKTPLRDVPVTYMTMSSRVPKVGEQVLLLTGKRSGSKNAQDIKLGAIIELDGATKKISLGLRSSIGMPDYTGAPAINSNGEFLGIVAEELPVTDKLKAAGVVKYRLEPSVFMEDEVNAN